MSGQINAADFSFCNLSDCTLVKLPGSINGNGFNLENLTNCVVHVLDHTSQVQVDDCTGCTILIGPCDGSVFVRDCKDCTLCVAGRQLRLRDCRSLNISCYCPTNPSIETSAGIVFSCWNGAYPGLTQHFTASKMDPTKNTWMSVYDFNVADDLGVSPHFTLDNGHQGWWEVPIEGGPPCDNPVPLAHGALYGGGTADGEQASPEDQGMLGSLPPSPGRAQNWDEEIDIADDDQDVPQDGDGGGGSATVSGGGAVPVMNIQRKPSMMMSRPAMPVTRLATASDGGGMLPPRAPPPPAAAQDAASFSAVVTEEVELVWSAQDDGGNGSGTGAGQGRDGVGMTSLPSFDLPSTPASSPQVSYTPEASTRAVSYAAQVLKALEDEQRAGGLPSADASDEAPAPPAALDAEASSDALGLPLPPPAVAAVDEAVAAAEADPWVVEPSAHPPHPPPPADSPAPAAGGGGVLHALAGVLGALVPGVLLGGAATPAGAAALEAGGDLRQAWVNKNAARLAAEDIAEASSKALTRTRAQAKLTDMHKARAAAVVVQHAAAQRVSADNASAAVGSAAGAGWTRVVTLLELGTAAAPSATDKARFKAMLMVLQRRDQAKGK